MMVVEKIKRSIKINGLNKELKLEGGAIVNVKKSDNSKIISLEILRED